MRSLILILTVTAVAGCRTEDHRAQAYLGEDVRVSVIVSPMFSLQSDWRRKLVIETATGDSEYILPEDTGWWRGSNLYLHSSGLYVLHEGQAGCVLFRAAPPELVNDPTISCENTHMTLEEDVVHAELSTQAFPASKFYTDFYYIGQFVETPLRQEPVSFIEADEQAEAELPDSM